MKTKLTSLAIVLLTIVSCNDSKKSTSETSENKEEQAVEAQATSDDISIEDTKWVITTLEGADMTNKEVSEQEIYFTLDSESKRISGNAGCNTFMGTYTLEEGNRISFSELGLTRMMCPDMKIEESQILSVFELADNFTIADGKLSLNKAKRAPLAEFKKVDYSNEPIVEKYWKLKTLEGKEVTMSDNQEREVFFTLKGHDQTVTGFAGCNTISGGYTLEDGNRIRFTQMATTLKACPDVDFNESEFLKIFELADNYTIDGDTLSLNVGRRAPLAVFEAVYMQ
ncbi:heat shock protein HslJ [Winogradskyella epiphytica]|uniref:Heat shock protein HslJ n=1 Tax=Winogradskyella epiphytica TaxID=262005 RepID=A0A2V4XVE1_9FLAO|nr:META domain-containing protein [Winogradskyella epiphytica]PYE82747.1 heat shock protein HslJ [Winogradskyella epiphytica]GGW53325.1 META domain-containing protein [Winogradskyella epiphytica]